MINNVLFHSYGLYKVFKSIETEGRKVVTKNWGKGTGEVSVNEYSSSVTR